MLNLILMRGNPKLEVRNLWRMVRGWASNQVAALNKEKVQLAKEYNQLEVLAESSVS